MLIYSMSVSVDGFIADRRGDFGWTVPTEDQFRFHLAQTQELGAYLCGRRLYETMLPWETDPSRLKTTFRRADPRKCSRPRPSREGAPDLGEGCRELALA
jgi:dihydrofolate reductase